MATTPDFSKIWASNSPLTPYVISDRDYLHGWDFVGAIPPARSQFDAWFKLTDEKFKFLYDTRFTPQDFDNGIAAHNKDTNSHPDLRQHIAAAIAQMANYLPLAGGNMTGDITFADGNRLIGVNSTIEINFGADSLAIQKAADNIFKFSTAGITIGEDAVSTNIFADSAQPMAISSTAGSPVVQFKQAANILAQLKATDGLVSFFKADGTAKADITAGKATLDEIVLGDGRIHKSPSTGPNGVSNDTFAISCGGAIPTKLFQFWKNPTKPNARGIWIGNFFGETTGEKTGLLSNTLIGSDSNFSSGVMAPANGGHPSWAFGKAAADDSAADFSGELVLINAGQPDQYFQVNDSKGALLPLHCKTLVEDSGAMFQTIELGNGGLNWAMTFGPWIIQRLQAVIGDLKAERFFRVNFPMAVGRVMSIIPMKHAGDLGIDAYFEVNDWDNNGCTVGTNSWSSSGHSGPATLVLTIIGAKV